MGRALRHAVPAVALAEELGLELVGEPTALILRVDAIGSARVGSLCFAKDSRWAANVPAEAILLTTPEAAASRRGSVTLISDVPRLDFARALATLERAGGFLWSAAAASVHPTARIGANTVLGSGVQVGEGSVIGHNVVIADEVIVGKRCVIKSGAVIGESGFGFERDEHGLGVRLPHVGTVIIEDNVEIGSLTTVCRGTLGDTVLRAHCKIDDHVHIAHNVEVGTGAFVIACAEVSGGARIGARAWIAPSASIMNQVTVGDDAVVGLGAVVIRRVADHSTVVGNPARPLDK